MSKNDATKWCKKLCQKWFQNMMPKIISTNDVKKWCQKMMSKNDIKNYAKTMPDMESGYPSTDLFDAMFGIIFDIILA